MKSVLQYFLPSFTFLICMYQPGTVQLSFAMASMLGMIQGRALQNEKLRERFGLSPFIKPTVEVAAAPTAPVITQPVWRPQKKVNSKKEASKEEPKPTTVTEKAKGAVKDVVAGAKTEVTGMVEGMRSWLPPSAGGGGAEQPVTNPHNSKQYLQEAQLYEQNRQSEFLEMRLQHSLRMRRRPKKRD
jgi:hypothetical protein